MKKGSPTRILYWLGGGLLLVAAAVLLLIRLAPGKQGEQAPDPERTVIWLYDISDPAAPAQVLLVEESRSQNTLSVRAFTASDDLQKAFGGNHFKAAQQLLSTQTGQPIHHRVFLPYSIVSTLIDSSKGVTAGGRDMTGAEAIAYIHAGGDVGPDRAARVLLSLAQGVAKRGIDMSASEGFRLARQVETDLDLTVLPDLLTRWSRYGAPSIRMGP
ncbi:MAG TPA: hypothetical protein VNT75_22630 [Symbiobacteriaceae bacterium]|nr:hypothetical protein [Symbiobacteriaceae bacterium]